MHRLDAFVFSGFESLTCNADGEGASGGGAPAPATQPPAVPSPAPQRTVDDGEPKYLSDRLERERRATLKKLGIEVDKDDDANSAIEKAKKKFGGWKEERNSLRNEVATLKDAATKTAADTAAVKVYAEAEMAALTDAQRDAVKKAAGESPAEQLKTIGAWRAAGMLKAEIQATPAPNANQQQPKTPPPADTAPPANAPPAVTTSPTDHRAQYESLRRQNPIAAAQYAAAHPEVYGKT